MTFNYDDFLRLLGLYFWPFVRITGMLMLMPLFSASYVSVNVRLMLAVFITLAVAPSLPLPAPIDPFTWHG
ncbi:MAG: flagellar biosynthetic protein FliR, partial [Thiotrichales bacterium]|nr:flagellar biosynthetic protein FliR [Thiotrichales bacterium]